MFVALYVFCLFPLERKYQVSRTPGCPGNLTFDACGLALWKSTCQDLLGEIYQRRTKGWKQEAGRTVRPQCSSEPQERRKGRKEDQLERISDHSTILRKFWPGPWEVLEPTSCILQEGVRNLTSTVFCQWQGLGAAGVGDGLGKNMVVNPEGGIGLPQQESQAAYSHGCHGLEWSQIVVHICLKKISEWKVSQSSPQLKRS